MRPAGRDSENSEIENRSPHPSRSLVGGAKIFLPFLKIYILLLAQAALYNIYYYILTTPENFRSLSFILN
jgi:hypothetical protein